MAEKKGFRSISGFGLFLAMLFMIWTCILVFAASNHYHFSQFAQKSLLAYLIEQGGGRAKAIRYLRHFQEENEREKEYFGRINLLSYLFDNQELSDSTSQDMMELASLYPGKNCEAVFWSAASGKKAAESRLFMQSDGMIAELAEEEKTEADRQDEGRKTAEVSEDATEPDIVLFQNGSPDITTYNKKESRPSATAVAAQAEILADSDETLTSNLAKIERLKTEKNRSYLLKNFYIKDSSTSIDNEIFHVESLLSMDLHIKKKKEPQILIFHTHGASESFKDSRAGRQEDSIVGVGTVLAKTLSKEYGYQVLHDKTEYDRVNGKIDRNKAYNNALYGLEKTLKQYPSIDVIIDLHRDGVGKKVNRTTTVNGKKTAQAMFFNGLSRNSKGDIAYLKNDNLQANLAFSLQLKLASMRRFQDFAKPVYLKNYRYNMHLKKRFTLIELGNENNTVQEEKNAATPLAMVLDAVLKGER